MNPRSFSERVAPWAPGERSQHKPPEIDPPKDMLQRRSLISLYLVIMLKPGSDAWHVVSFADPLLDSDEELADEHVHLDYSSWVPVTFPLPQAHLDFPL
jgi:hypothetical protein